MSWTDERVELLRQAWMEGKSASQIAGLLGHGLTRNAVIGKVHRLGLSGRAKSLPIARPPARPGPSQQGERPASSAAPPPTAAAAASTPRPSGPAAARMMHGATALAMRPEAIVADEPQVIESVVIPMSLRVTIVELRESMCRWPLGDPTSAEFRYCGSPTQSGPYCAHHGGLAYQPTDSRRRDRDRRLALR